MKIRVELQNLFKELAEREIFRKMDIITEI